ncbi:MAG: CDP-alcohol phosphatidyltransferase family protein [Hadesarchaea archaeon]|nr:CDP-alcohol phosphatidyltransferase family protein [Hadesarchaea archaeon]
MLSSAREKIDPWINALARPFAEVGLGPNTLTVIGALLGSLAAVLFALQEPARAGAILLLSGFFDAIDGAVARMTGGPTLFGGILDSVLDRYVDFAILAGIIWGGLAEFAGQPSWFWGVLALAGSLMVSYTRARAEASGTGKLAVGIAERGERILILAVGGIIGCVNYAVVLVAVLTHVTVAHRMIVAWQRLVYRWR